MRILRAAVLILASLALEAEAAEVRLAPVDRPLTAGTTFAMPISVEGSTRPFGGYLFDLVFDHSLLILESLAPEGDHAFSDEFFKNSGIGTGGGRMAGLNSRSLSGPVGSADLTVARFRVIPSTQIFISSQLRNSTVAVSVREAVDMVDTRASTIAVTGATLSYEVVGDTLAPVTQINFVPPSALSDLEGRPVISTFALVGFSAQDIGAYVSGVALTGYLVDQDTMTAAFVTSTAPFTLAAGTHTVIWSSRDVAGNVEVVRSTQVLVKSEDETPPTLSLSPPEGGTVTTDRPSIVANYADATSGVDVASIRLTLDGIDVTAQAAVTASSAVFVPVAALSQGSHTATAAVADHAGNVSTASSTFFLDSVPPETTLVVGDPRFSSATLFVTAATPFGLTASEPALTFYAVDSSTFLAYSGTFTLTALGTSTVQFYSIDLAGNVEATRGAQASVDGLPPRTAASFGEPKFAGSRLYLSSTTPIHFTAADDLADVGDERGAGAAQTLLSVDSSAFAAVGSTVSLSLEGERALSWYSLDLVGNAELASGASIAVDATPPVTRLDISTPMVSQSSGMVVGPATVLSLAALDPVSSGTASGLKDTFLAVSTSVFAPAPAAFTLTGEDGTRMLSFYSRDNVLNVEQVVRATVRLDATAPQTALLVVGGYRFPGPDAATFYASSDTRLALPAFDPVAGGVASGLAFTRYQDGGGPFQNFVSTFGLSEGAHRLGYQSQDNVHNLEILRGANVWIDAAPPVSTFTFGATYHAAADGTHYVTPATPVTFSAVDPALPTGQPGSGVNRIEVAVDGGPFAVYSSALLFAEGRHTVVFRAVDNVANSEAARTLHIRSDATPPASSLVIGEPRFQLPGVLLVSTRTPFSIDVVDPVSADVASGVKDIFYRVSDFAPGGAAFQAFATPFSMAGLDVSKVIEFYSRDNVLNTEAIKSGTVLLDSTPPELALRSPGTCDSGICRVVNGRFPVLGTARDAHFRSYALEFAPGKDAGADFSLISSGTVAVSSGTLGVWNASALGGWQTLRLRASDLVQNGAVLTLNVFVGDPATVLVLGGHDTFNMPEGVAVGADGKIYVADRNNDRVAVFSSTGAALASFGGRGRDDDDDQTTSTLRLKRPAAVAVDAAGSIFVADTGNHRVLKLSPAGQVMLDIGRRKLEREEEEGKVDLEIEHKPGKQPGQFKSPSGIAVDAAGRIYVSDTDNHRVQVFSSTGAFSLVFELPAVRQASDDDEREEKDPDDDERPRLGKPVGIALDLAANIYVADPKGRRALAFDAAGRLLMTVPVLGRNGRNVAQPVGIAVSPSGDCLMVSDQQSGRILKYDFSGNLSLVFGGKANKENEDGGRRSASSIKLRKPAGLAMDADGALYVADRNDVRIKKFTLPDGSATAFAPAQGPEDDDIAREVIDREDGGRVERRDRAAVSIPADALLEDLRISVSTPTAAVADESRRGADDKNMKVASQPVEFQPHGTEFEKPVTLTIPYNPELLAAQNAADADLKVHYWNPKKKAWEELESTVDKPNRVVRAKTTHFSVYQVYTGTSTSTVAAPLAADASFGVKAAYAFPNPARGVGAVTIRIQPGLADSVQVNVYDAAGRKVHSSSDFRNLGAFDDGNGLGAQFTYEHVWDLSGVGSGVYAYVITARKSGERDIHRSGKIGVVK